MSGPRRARKRESGQVTNEWIIIVLLVAAATVIILGMYGRTIASKFSCAAKSVSSGQGLTFSCPGDAAGGGDKPAPGRDGQDAPAKGLPAPSGGSSGGGGAGGSSGSGGGGSPQDRLEQAKDLVRNSPDGKDLLEFLENNGVEIEIGSGDGSYFDDQSGDRIVIDESESLEDMIFTIPHEATHAERNKKGTSGDVRNSTRDEYIDTMIEEETDATVAGIEVKRDLEATGQTVSTTFPLEREYREAYSEKYDQLMKERKSGKKFRSLSQIQEEAKKAGREAVRDGFNSGKVLPGTDRNVTYRDYYGRKYDEDRTNPGGFQPPPGPKAASPDGIGFAGDVPPDVGGVVDKFNDGEIGASVKDRQVAGKTMQQIEDEIGAEGGGWVDAGNGVRMTADGKWKYSEGSMTEGGQKVKLVFFENVDGGVIRLKPDGVPNSNFESMRGPHGAVYVKKDPNGDNGWANEAFKVSDGEALPKTPLHVEPPPGIQKYTPEGAAWREANPNAESAPRGDPPIKLFTDEFEAYLKESGWVKRTHVGLGR